MRLLTGLVVLLLASCGGSAPDASGALVLDLEEEHLGADVIDARIATAVEVLESRPILERVVHELALDHPPAPDPIASLARAVHASRRGSSLVVDVEVSLEDPADATHACNALLEAYLESRIEAHLQPITTELEWISSQLETLADVPEAAPQRERLRERAAQLEREQTSSRGRAGARVLERCERRVR